MTCENINIRSKLWNERGSPVQGDVRRETKMSYQSWKKHAGHIRGCHTEDKRTASYHLVVQSTTVSSCVKLWEGAKGPTRSTCTWSKYLVRFAHTGVLVHFSTLIGHISSQTFPDLFTEARLPKRRPYQLHRHPDSWVQQGVNHVKNSVPSHWCIRTVATHANVAEESRTTLYYSILKL